MGLDSMDGGVDFQHFALRKSTSKTRSTTTMCVDADSNHFGMARRGEWQRDMITRPQPRVRPAHADPQDVDRGHCHLGHKGVPKMEINS